MKSTFDETIRELKSHMAQDRVCMTQAEILIADAIEIAPEIDGIHFALNKLQGVICAIPSADSMAEIDRLLIEVERIATGEREAMAHLGRIAYELREIERITGSHIVTTVEAEQRGAIVLIVKRDDAGQIERVWLDRDW